MVARPVRALQNIRKNMQKLAYLCRQDCCLQPHFHHNLTTIYHAVHHVLRTENRKNPCKNALPPSEKNYKIYRERS